MIVQKIRDNLYNHCGYDGSGMVVGVSGGADSMLLLHSLLQTEPADKLCVLHVNHNIRGEEAWRDQIHVERYCSEHGVPFVVVSRDVPAEAEFFGRSLEETARLARYEELTKLAKSKGFSYIACAHHANDRAETVMMNILRGSGIRGLRGMDFVSGQVLRPMLDISRQQIMEYVIASDIPYVKDSTNDENVYRRNWIRNQLFQYIRENSGVDIVERLNSMADLAGEDSDCLEEMSDKLYGQARVAGTSGQVVLNIGELAHIPPAISKRIIRRAIMEVKGDLVDVARSHVESVLGICNRTGKRLSLPHGLEVRVDYDRLTIARGDLAADAVMTAPTISFSLEDYSPEDGERYHRMNKSPDKTTGFRQMAFDADKIFALGQPEIRHRASGDMVKLPGVGNKKLKDWLIDNKIPLEQRDRLWVLACGNRVLALPEFRAFGGFEPCSRTQKVLIIRIDYDNKP